MRLEPGGIHPVRLVVVLDLPKHLHVYVYAGSGSIWLCPRATELGIFRDEVRWHYGTDLGTSKIRFCAKGEEAREKSLRLRPEKAPNIMEHMRRVISRRDI